jgi:hypothetical protein
MNLSMAVPAITAPVAMQDITIDIRMALDAHTASIKSPQLAVR